LAGLGAQGELGKASAIRVGGSSIERP